MARKRFDLFKYNLMFRVKRGQAYDINQDINVLQKTTKVMNIMDMSDPREIFLLDVHSDATEYGGLSETLLLHNEKQGYLRMTAKFIRERHGLQLQDNMMYCGF